VASWAARHVPFRLLVAGDGNMLPDLWILSARNLAIATTSSGWETSSIRGLFLPASVGEAFGLVVAEHGLRSAGRR